ncbi:hypothetical protein ACIBBE_24115 [Streptomyces sp. NPDC051644]|uniref:hypothetical protein n=1 Tax=Streptomyces sp. NPDC051644 TaxID=3365666 RepID=UPI0037A328E5
MSTDTALYERLDAEETKHRAAIEDLQKQIGEHGEAISEIAATRKTLARIFGDEISEEVTDPAPAPAEEAVAGPAVTALTPEAGELAEEPVQEGGEEDVLVQETADPAPAVTPAPEAKSSKRAPKPKKKNVPAQRTGERREKIVNVLSGSGEPMRAGQVAEAIGMLNPSHGDVEGVRNHLDRMAKGGQVRKPGRGLYEWIGQ